METMEQTLTAWRKEEFSRALGMMKDAISILSNEQDVVKQGECAKYFNVSVNTLKAWIIEGAPEIRLESGMPLYSKRSIHEWLLSHQK